MQNILLCIYVYIWAWNSSYRVYGTPPQPQDLKNPPPPPQTRPPTLGSLLASHSHIKTRENT